MNEQTNNSKTYGRIQTSHYNFEEDDRMNRQLEATKAIGQTKGWRNSIALVRCINGPHVHYNVRCNNVKRRVRITKKHIGPRSLI